MSRFYVPTMFRNLDIAHVVYFFFKNCGKYCFIRHRTNPPSFDQMKNSSKGDLVLFVNDCVTGKTPNGAAIKGIDTKGQTRTLNHQGPSTKKVKFDSSSKEEEMETEIEDPGVITDEGPESAIVARAPSFFIGKPLKDYDASNGRVSPHPTTTITIT